MFVAEISGCTLSSVRGYIQELDGDDPLRAHVRRRTVQGPMRGVSDPVMRPGKRTAYYVLVRSLKPKVVVEAGVDKGLGSVIMAAALLRNAQDGRPGKIIGLDVKPDAGFLLGPPYDAVVELRIGDAIAAIRNVEETVDLFLQDIAPGLEEALLEAVEPHLGAHGVALSVWHSGAMMRFAESTHRRFAVFVEETRNHWYPGARIVVAYHGPATWLAPTSGD